LNAAKALTTGHLRKDHAQKLIPAGEAFEFEVAIVPLHALMKLVRGEKIHPLGENSFSGSRGRLILEFRRFSRVSLSGRQIGVPQDNLAGDLDGNPGAGGVGCDLPTKIGVYLIPENVRLTDGLIDPSAAFSARQVVQATVSTAG
jgi:hypothetical protein